MKNSTLAKIVLVGVVLASSLSAASAATRQQMRAAAASATQYGYGAGPLSNVTDNQFVDNEQARRDIENAGG